MVAKWSPDISAKDTIEVLSSRILVDGFHLVVDLERSRGSKLHDARTGRNYLDFYSFFASQPVGYNHPRMHDPEFQARLLLAATTKVANPDVYTQFYAEFVKTTEEVVGVPGFDHFFFIDGGALAVENALKAAFDWKIRKNLKAGRGELGSRVIHFKQAFHGRTGYTLSLTNTSDPRKTMYFPKFDWPRVDNPMINFELPEPQRSQDVAAREAESVRQILDAITKHPHDCACILIETIQGEGGDNHFRPEFFKKLREICDQHELLLIFDEVQCGIGITGKAWAFEHHSIAPDIICFGKKMQICGIMANRRLDEVDSVFAVPSRINSTFGGNLADMVRATQYLKIIRDENLFDHAAAAGVHLLDGLLRLKSKHKCVTNVRGRGLMCAIDLPDGKFRDAVRSAAQERQLMVLSCGDQSIRFRPLLDVEPADLDQGVELLDEAIIAAGQKCCGHCKTA
ncbi:MAG: L-lysine 6-transaminase [Phycisphaerae bacterium]